MIIARNALDHDEVKYFLSNVAVGSDIEKLKWVVHVAFSRFPIGRYFRQAKDELGLDHFEVRGWRSIHRHMYVTQLSHLFCSRMRQALREKTVEHAELTVEQVAMRLRSVDRTRTPPVGVQPPHSG